VAFPPSPDGGFIEGDIGDVLAIGDEQGFHHLQMLASLRGRQRLGDYEHQAQVSTISRCWLH